MTISFADGPGNFPTVIGKIGNVIKETDDYLTNQQTNLVDQSIGLAPQLTTTANQAEEVRAVLGENYISILDSTGQTGGSIMQNVASAYINRLIFDDNPQQNQTLQSQNTLASLREIIRQAEQEGATVLEMTVGSTDSDWTGTGDGVLFSSTTRPLDVRSLENAFAEIVTAVVQTDSYNGTATAGQEAILLTGTGQEQNVFAFNWPLGSDGTITLSAIDGSQDNSGGNILTNSDFEDWTNDLPDNYTIVTGTGGTDINEETTLVYDGLSALRVDGDGIQLIEFKQEFNDGTDGTSGELEVSSKYSFCIWLRTKANIPTQGQLRIQLVDSNNTIINDAAGNANELVVDCTTLTTVYTPYKLEINTPTILPTTYFIRYFFDEALDTGESVYMDRAGLGLMEQLYTSGPYFSVHSGAVPFAINTRAEAIITNSRGAGGTLATFQTLLARLFPDIITEDLLFPSSSTPSIPDSLIG